MVIGAPARRLRLSPFPGGRGLPRPARLGGLGRIMLIEPGEAPDLAEGGPPHP
jgi:hypothetical protein